MLPEQLQDALWDLVWAGEVTNDTLAPLRALLRPRREGRRASRLLALYRSRRPSPPTAAGRWSLLPRPDLHPAPSATERLTALAGQLLLRHGILTRDAVAFEGIAGGFAGLYPVLSALENQGRIRRGYFVAGLGGSQFADAGALDRLRALREVSRDDPPSVRIVAAADPANPYGAVLPWPKESGRLSRSPGTHALLVDGRLTVCLWRDGADLWAALPEQEPERSRAGRAAARALALWASRTGRVSLGWASADPRASRGPMAPFLVEAGFQASGPGFRLRPKS